MTYLETDRYRFEQDLEQLRVIMERLRKLLDERSALTERVQEESNELAVAWDHIQSLDATFDREGFRQRVGRLLREARRE